MKYLEVKGYWKDTKERIDGFIMAIGEYDETVNDALDEIIAYYFDDEVELLEAHKEETGFQFILESYELISLNWTVEKKDEIESILFGKWGTFGMDIPSNYEDIVQFCYEDVCTVADVRNWSDGDVAIAFRRWVEKQSGVEYIDAEI